MKAAASRFGRSVGDLFARGVGAILYRVRPRSRARYLAFHDPERRAGLQALLASCAQRYALTTAPPPFVAARDDEGLLEESLEPDRYVEELRDALTRLTYLARGILNTEALFLWSLIRCARPGLYLESGTGRGYSAALAAEALGRNGGAWELYTFGVAEPDVVETARSTLRRYPNCHVVEGRSEEELPRRMPSNGLRVGAFIDGPKGSSPAFLQLLDRLFARANPLFVAVHDCEAHLPRGFDPAGKWPHGRINPTRAQLEYFFEEHGLESDYVLAFMDNEWCLRYEDLNRPIYKNDEMIAPFSFKGSRQVSHSPIIGALLSRRLIGELQGTPVEALAHPEVATQS